MSTAVKIGSVLLAGVAILALIGWLVLRLLVASVDGQEALTDPVVVEVVSAEPDTWGTSGNPYEGHVVRYRYTHGGATWQHETRLTDTEWRVGGALDACVDPDDGARHALRVFDAPCGEVVNTGVVTAEPA